MSVETNLLVRRLVARVLFGTFTKPMLKRRDIAYKWLSGQGIEIGALHNPLPTPSEAQVKYVDVKCNSELQQVFPEVTNTDMVDIDLIDDGETLSTIVDKSQDFVIANHVLEHCVNPIGALQTWLRVLKNGGVAYIAVPDKRFTFDYQRPVTTWEHLSDDFNGNAEKSQKVHYTDWLSNVVMLTGEEFNCALRDALKNQPNIHFHTWTSKSLQSFFASCQIELSFPFVIVDFVRNGIELIVIVKKTV